MTPPRQNILLTGATGYIGSPTWPAPPIREDSPPSGTNPCGRAKLLGETLLRDLGAADATWQTACLLYFNPVSAHESGLIGEDPRGAPNDLMPDVAQVAIGRRPQLQVHGNDYATLDGTGVLDAARAYELPNAPVPFAMSPRQPGDIDACGADATLARELVGQQARHGLQRIWEDSWRWQLNNTNGVEA